MSCASSGSVADLSSNTYEAPRDHELALYIKEPEAKQEPDPVPEPEPKPEPIPVPEPEPAPKMAFYEGSVLHIFFHPLVARPETAFSSRYREHFLEWYVTADEYEKILYEFYANNYVLVDVNEVYEAANTGNVTTVAYRKPFIPEGKKPLLLSIDDLSYYENVRRYASVHKLVIDSSGNIAAWTDGENGGVFSYNLDAVTYLEEFIKKHPDFSVRGARGIIALTGYEGVFGYATHRINATGYEEEKQRAIAVANKLKQLGWRFASHSYDHPHLPAISVEKFIADADRWDMEVRPVIGGTNLFIYPFGEGVERNDEKHRILRERNFNVFFGVGSGTEYRIRPGYIFSERKNIDGVYFRVFRNRADRLFNIENVIDPARSR